MTASVDCWAAQVLTKAGDRESGRPYLGRLHQLCVVVEQIGYSGGEAGEDKSDRQLITNEGLDCGGKLSGFVTIGAVDPL